uniref:SecY-independent transporter protein n=1 Tax=Protohalopteris sp. TaxID=2843287 RepID=A0A8F0FDI8_9PHAE|nr:SecY-independent transporter protein [Protohalopteris sp.]
MKKFKFSIHYIHELNYRLTYTGIGTALLFSISYIHKQTLIYLLIPKGISHFISTDLTEIFTTYLNLCTNISIVIGIMISVIQLYLFLRPGLYRNEAKKSFTLIIITLCFYIFIYILALPIIIQLSWEFFSSYTKTFNPTQLIFDPQLKNYLNYIYELSIIINFSYPLIITLNLILSYVQIIILTKHRKIVYFITFTTATILTPPDIISQTFVGVFIIMFYEIQIIIWMIYKKYNNYFNYI